MCVQRYGIDEGGTGLVWPAPVRVGDAEDLSGIREVSTHMRTVMECFRKYSFINTQKYRYKWRSIGTLLTLLASPRLH